MIFSDQSVDGDDGIQSVDTDHTCLQMLKFWEKKASPIDLHCKRLMHPAERQTVQHKPHIEFVSFVGAEGRIEAQANTFGQNLVYAALVPVSGRVFSLYENEVADENRRSTLCQSFYFKAVGSTVQTKNFP